MTKALDAAIRGAHEDRILILRAALPTEPEAGMIEAMVDWAIGSDRASWMPGEPEAMLRAAYLGLRAYLLREDA